MAPENESVENDSPAPVMLSTSLIVADAFRSMPDGCTVALAVAVVVPGIAMPVTLSTYVPVATSLRFVVPDGTVVVWVNTRMLAVLAGRSIGPAVDALSNAVVPE